MKSDHSFCRSRSLAETLLAETESILMQFRRRNGNRRRDECGRSLLLSSKQTTFIKHHWQIQDATQTSDEVFFCFAQKNKFEDKSADSSGCHNAKRRSHQGGEPSDTLTMALS